MRIESIYSVHVLHIIVNALLGKRNIRRARLYFLPSFLKGYCVSFYLFSRHPVIFPSKRKIWNKKNKKQKKKQYVKTFYDFFSCWTGDWERLSVHFDCFFLLLCHHYCLANINPSLNHRVA